MSIRTSAISATILALATTGLAVAHAAPPSQQEPPQLPAEVQDWLERDQIIRWAGLLRAGQELYAEGSCGRCHGEAGVGGNWGPDLTDAEWVQSDGSLENIYETIMWGVRRRDFADPSRRFQMNPSGGMELTHEDRQALTAYIWSLSNGTHLPGRNS